ncbi:MAG: glucose-1-phosphate adenylyltransferase [Gammaproteobacteria bacterium]|nr:glucose-1-phosphate adenylyltransferase [Gammaproteobacteria bacterium]
MLISDLHDALALVMAIGDGKTLDPLTARRATAAMPFGGTYRIIDFALTNCLHSGLRRIMVMTQYNALSLQNHIRDGWSIYNTDLGEFITPVTPPIGDAISTYAGAADALYKNLYLLEGVRDDNVILISGEQIYRMDYAALLAWHSAQGADVTIAGVSAHNAHGADFPAAIELAGDEVRAVREGRTMAATDDQLLWPMRVSVFKRSALIDLLHTLDGQPPSRLSLTALIGRHLGAFKRVVGYHFGGTTGRVSQDRYWRRLDSLDAYYNANMDLLELEPPLDLYQPNWQIRTYQTQRPPARTVPGRSCNEGICVNSIVSGGTVIAGGGVNHSVLGNRVYIDDGATVEDSILFSDVRVGEGAQVRRCICDRSVQIPPGEQIGFDAADDARRFDVTPEGVVVIPSDHVFE